MTKQRKTSNLLIVGLLIATSFVVLTPSAAAHSCTAEEGSPMQSSCEAECTEGEDHSHAVTHHHENGPFADENHIHYECSSEDPDDCDGTTVLGLCVIEIQDGILVDICDIVEDPIKVASPQFLELFQLQFGYDPELVSFRLAAIDAC